ADPARHPVDLEGTVGVARAGVDVEAAAAALDLDLDRRGAEIAGVKLDARVGESKTIEIGAADGALPALAEGRDRGRRALSARRFVDRAAAAGEGQDHESGRRPRHRNLGSSGVHRRGHETSLPTRYAAAAPPA